MDANRIRARIRASAISALLAGVVLLAVNGHWFGYPLIAFGVVVLAIDLLSRRT